MNLPKSLHKHQHLIKGFEDMRKYNEGYWIYLKDELVSPEMECRTIHEYTIKDCVRMLSTVIEG